MVLLVLCSSANMEKSQHAQVATAESAVIYAGFWLRLVAALVDMLATFIPFCFVAFIVTVIVKLVSATKGYEPATVILTVLPPVAIVAAWLYFAVMESSSWQATFGKKLLGLYVTDMSGQRLSLSRATGRTFVKFLSSMTAGIGYLLCGVTEKKQALHDLVASCLVLRGPR
jgi:uncharacterized RDD family membrane protein YckC